ncbi:hypothetical protein GCM10025768_12980 [Microbacterium pseudoresistens]|uniref:DUF4352 domain-containing protein n=1 Tax=Microbacterium pseudoresistens TaxID=640634 RepID=A0A7Y9EWP7_9MICO|nr:hypothetical protein [Microbacterium pseudoresistens]NYD55201.1 hypothetical protein [Microbacterium pseudoresistens]
MGDVTPVGAHARRSWTPLLVVIGAAVLTLVAAVALSGGFADKPATASEIPALKQGDVHTNDRFSVRIDHAVVADENEASGVRPDDGERVLAITVEVENVSDEAFSTTSALAPTLTIPAFGDDADPRISRIDDGTRNPWLQPGLPTRLMMAWAVPRDVLQSIVDDEQLEVLVLDPHRYELSVIATGVSWKDTTPGATMRVVVEDAGGEVDR